jgi:hypothetical protein
MWKIILIILALAYTINPYDLFPDLMLGWGWLDDLIILGLLWRYLAFRKKKPFNYQNYFRQRQAGFDGDFKRSFFDEQSTGPRSQDAENKAALDPHDVLGIAKGASLAEIKQAYRQLANKYHPDKVEYLGEEFKELADRRFKEIHSAYQELRRRFSANQKP